jgi:hypothetical protein
MAFKVKNLRKFLKPLLFILVGVIIGSSMLCGCSRQGFVGSRPANITDPNMNKDVPGVNNNSWRQQTSNPSETYTTNDGLSSNMYLFANNEFKPECCETSSISGSKGCACITSEQKKFLGQRGNNCANGPCSF